VSKFTRGQIVEQSESQVDTRPLDIQNTSTLMKQRNQSNQYLGKRTMNSFRISQDMDLDEQDDQAEYIEYKCTSYVLSKRRRTVPPTNYEHLAKQGSTKIVT
jgi:hypothetical protein